MENNPEITRRTCRNCLSPLPDDAVFCPQCSQKYTTGRIPVAELINEFVSVQFNLDSKIIKTAFALFNPGKLTIEYFKGKHQSYVNPLRIFLVTAVFLFAFVSFKTGDLNIDTDGTDFIATAEKELALQNLDSINRVVSGQFNNPEVNAALDSVFLAFKTVEGGGGDSIPLSLFQMDKLLVAPKDIADLEPDELADKYNITATFERMIFKQTVKAMKDGKGLFQYFLGKLTLMILLMMPVLALFLNLLYFRRDFYYVEHLIFSFHYHAFVFLICIFLTLFGGYMGGWVALFITGIFVYQFMAMKRVYAQSFGKTLLKFLILNFMYLILSTLFFALTVFISFVLF